MAVVAHSRPFVIGLIELHRRIARGFRNRENCRLRMLLVAGGLDQPPPQV